MFQPKANRKLNRRKAFQAAPSDLDPTFVAGKRRSGDEVHLQHGPWKVRPDTYVQNNGQTSVTYYEGANLPRGEGRLHVARLPEERPSRSVEVAEHVQPHSQVVAVDAAQFLDDGIAGVGNDLADRGVRVIVAGTDMDFRGEPFGPMPLLLAIAERVDKLHAICVV